MHLTNLIHFIIQMHSNTHVKHQDKLFPALSDAYQRTKELLQQNKESIQKVAELLLKKEVIDI